MDKMKVKEILNFTGQLLFFLVSGLLLLFIVLELFLPKMTVKIFQYKPYTVVTDSMEPVIFVGDMVIVKNPTNKRIDSLQVGDIITFEGDIDLNGVKEVITHYIMVINVDDEGFRTYRTNSEVSSNPDPWVISDQDILGVYAFRIPWIGNLVNFVRSPYGIAAISVNVIVIGAIIYIVKTGKKEKIEAPQ